MAALQIWVERKLRLTGKEAEIAAFTIARAIGRRGTKGAHMFQKGFDASAGNMMRVFFGCAGKCIKEVGRLSIEVIRAELHSIVAGVEDAGIVHDRLRWSNEWPDFLTLFKTNIGGLDQIRGWQVRYGGFGELDVVEFHDVADDHGMRPHRFLIQGFMGLDDSRGTEKVMTELAESVCDALDASQSIRAPNYYYADPAVMSVFEPRLFGGVLCHFAEITQIVVEAS